MNEKANNTEKPNEAKKLSSEQINDPKMDSSSNSSAQNNPSANKSNSSDNAEQKTSSYIEQQKRNIDVVQVFKHLLFALVAGVICGLGSVFLCLCIGWSYDLFEAFSWIIWLLPILGVLELLLYKAFKLPQDMTTHYVINQMRADDKISPLLAPGILLGTCMTIVCGGSVGKEAGALQMGASLSSTIAQPFKLKPVMKNAEEDMNSYVAALGMAAEFSALFFAPIGSTLFVLELMRFKPQVNKHIFTILVACFVAFLVSSAFGIGDKINVVDIPDITWITVGFAVVLGVASAFAGTLFNAAIDWIHDLTWRISKNFHVWVIVGGLIFAILVTIFGWHTFTGSGGNILNDALRRDFDVYGFAIKMLLTLICLGFWFKGGEIMPSFCIGGLLGASSAYVLGADVAFGCAIGAICFFAAFSRCPLGAFFMGCEIFGWAAAPYLAIGIFIAFNFGSPIGAFGDGVDETIRIRWHGFLKNLKNVRINQRRKGQLSDMINSEEDVRAVKDFVENPANLATKVPEKVNDKKE